VLFDVVPFTSNISKMNFLVFTKEDLDNFQQIDDSGTPDILNIPTKLMTLTIYHAGY
jgi:hypothetical protein